MSKHPCYRLTPRSSTASQDELLGVAVLSSSDAWAVGYQGKYKTLVERWNGTA